MTPAESDVRAVTFGAMSTRIFSIALLFVGAPLIIAAARGGITEANMMTVLGPFLGVLLVCSVGSMYASFVGTKTRERLGIDPIQVSSSARSIALYTGIGSATLLVAFVSSSIPLILMVSLGLSIVGLVVEHRWVRGTVKEQLEKSS